MSKVIRVYRVVSMRSRAGGSECLKIKIYLQTGFIG